MRNEQGGVLKNSFIYAASGLLIKCVNFFLLPLYSAHLSTLDYGVTSVATSFISTLSYIVSFSLYSAVMRFFVDLKDDEVRLKRFYGTIISFVFLSSCIWFFLFLLLRNWLSLYIFSGVDFFPTIFICIFSIFFTCQYTICENMLRSQQKAIKCSILSFCYFLIIIVCNILFVFIFEMGAKGVLLSTLIASFLYTIFFWIDAIANKTCIICFDIPLLKSALKYSIPIMPHNLSTQIAELFSKSFLGGKFSLSGVGIMSIATQFGTIADTIQVYVNNAYAPWLYEQLHQRDEGYTNTIRETVKTLISIIGFCMIGIALFSQDFILLFMDYSYAEAWKYVPLVVGMYAIKTTYWFHINILFYFKKASRILFISTLSGSIVNIFLSCCFIPLLGIWGSLIADILAMIIRVVIVVIISNRFDATGLHLKDFLVNLFSVFFVISIGLLPSYMKGANTFSLYNFCYKMGLVFLYFVFFALVHRRRIKQLIMRLKKRTCMLHE